MSEIPRSIISRRFVSRDNGCNSFRDGDHCLLPLDRKSYSPTRLRMIDRGLVALVSVVWAVVTVVNMLGSVILLPLPMWINDMRSEPTQMGGLGKVKADIYSDYRGVA